MWWVFMVKNKQTFSCVGMMVVDTHFVLQKKTSQMTETKWMKDLLEMGFILQSFSVMEMFSQ